MCFHVCVHVCARLISDTGEKDLELSNALLEEYFLQQALGEHSNIVKFLLGGLYRGKNELIALCSQHNTELPVA